MSETFFVAIATYGREMVRTPDRKRLSAYKIGRLTTAAMLVAAVGDQGRHISRSRASYQYVQLDFNPYNHQGYVLLQVDERTLTRLDEIARGDEINGAYLWRDNQWHAFPSSHRSTYQPVTDQQRGPGFIPAHSLASTDEAPPLIVEYSKRYDHDKPWWWIRGNTYPHRELLRQSGARWHNKRRCWYYVGETLPAAIRALIEDPGESPNDPGATIPAETQTTPEPQAEVPPEPVRERLKPFYSVGQTVYAPHDLEHPDGQTIPTGLSGQIIRVYERDRIRDEHSYDVRFTGHETAWFFQNELTGFKASANIRVTRNWLVPPGATPPPTAADIRAQLRQNGQMPEVIESDDEPCSLEEAHTVLNGAAAPPQARLSPASRFHVAQVVYTSSHVTHDGVHYDPGLRGQVDEIFPPLTPRGTASYRVNFPGVGDMRLLENDLSDSWRTKDGPQPARFQAQDEVYARHDLIASQGTVITGDPGKVIQPYGWSDEHGCYRYLVRFSDSISHICDEAELTDQAPPAGQRIDNLPVVGSDHTPAAVTSTILSLQDTRQPLPAIRPARKQTLPIFQPARASIGELSGSVSAAVYAYGAAFWDQTLVYLDMGGPKTGVEAVHATISKRSTVLLRLEDAPAREMTFDENDRYLALRQGIEEARFQNTILIHRWIEPQLFQKRAIFIEAEPQQLQLQIIERIKSQLSIAVLPHWYGYLWQAGQQVGWIRPLECLGGIRLWGAQLHQPEWEALIRGGLESRLIHLQETNNTEESHEPST